MSLPNPHLRMFLEAFDDGEVVDVDGHRCLVSRFASAGLIAEVIQPCQDAVRNGEAMAAAGRKGLIAVPESGLEQAAAMARAANEMRGGRA